MRGAWHTPTPWGQKLPCSGPPRPHPTHLLTWPLASALDHVLYNIINPQTCVSLSSVSHVANGQNPGGLWEPPICSQVRQKLGVTWDLLLAIGT